MNTMGPYWWQVNTGPGNGLAPSDNNPLGEQMLTQIYVATWCHWALIGYLILALCLD